MHTAGKSLNTCRKMKNLEISANSKELLKPNKAKTFKFNKIRRKSWKIKSRSFSNNLKVRIKKLNSLNR